MGFGGLLKAKGLIVPGRFRFLLVLTINFRFVRLGLFNGRRSNFLELIKAIGNRPDSPKSIGREYFGMVDGFFSGKRFAVRSTMSNFGLIVSWNFSPMGRFPFAFPNPIADAPKIIGASFSASSVTTN
jgi:hypothetical protein